jgi:DNA polymerase sigma
MLPQHKDKPMIRKLFAAVHGTLWGCAVTILVLSSLLMIELVLFGLLDLNSNLKTYSLLIAVCVGG